MTATAAATHRFDERTALRRLAVPSAAAFFVLGVGGSLASLTGGLDEPVWFAAFSLFNVTVFSGAALLWLRYRPANRVGVVLLALAGISAVQSFLGASSSVPFSIAVLFDPVYLLTWTYLVVTYPTGRPKWRESGVLILAAVVCVVGFVPSFFFTPHVFGATPLARCTAACPENAFMIVNWPLLARHFDRAEDIGLVAFAVSFVVLLVVRLIGATRPGRRILAPIYIVAIAWGVAFGVYGVANDLFPGSPSVRTGAGWFLTGMRFALPLAFALAIVAARSFAGVALGTMIARIRHLQTAGELQRVAGHALGDPSLRLAVWNAGSNGWVDVDGAEIGPPPAELGRSWREIPADGRESRAALDYDVFLDQTPELVDAAASAVKLSLEARLLESELRTTHEELGDSVLRSATIAAEQRRRFERDLHDSAQQRLVVIGMDLQRLRGEAGSDSAAEELGRLGEQVNLVLAEIRDVARGQLPPTLNDLGLRAALAVATRGNPRVVLKVGTVERHAPEAEAAVYFSVLEAIQNATKHGAPTTRIDVSVWSGVGVLHFQVTDDGPGFDPAVIPVDGGLAGLSRRLQAFGGSLDITSAAGEGATIAGHVPTA